jgi:hypothetical protein
VVVLRRLAPAVALILLVLVEPAQAQRTVLMPGVTYEPGVQFTLHGPVALHIVTAPRPGGAYRLEPVLSNETIVGTERLTSMERRLAATATMVGTNADFWQWSTGRPSGVFMRDGELASPPHGGRSSVGIAADGSLDVRRVEFFARWQGAGPRRVLSDLNDLPQQNAVTLYTSAWGDRTPFAPGAVSAVLFPFPAAAPDVDLQAPVVDVRHEARIAIPSGGAVLVARGSEAAVLEREAPVGTTVAVRLILRPDWAGVADAVGGGPQLVRDGVPVFRPHEAFTTIQLAPRSPRTAVGQRADGSLVLVVTDGRRPGYSVGMTNFELAQTMVRLGAVTASALDSGGSSTLAFEGRLLNRPSDPGGERSISTGLVLAYTGVFVPPPAAVVSPNGDGVDEAPGLRVKLVRPSTVTLTMLAPDGSTAYTATEAHVPGRFAVPFPPPAPSARATGGAVEPEPGELPQGRWRLLVEATDDVGQLTRMGRAFTVNETLGFLATERQRLFLPPGGRAFGISWRQGREAHVVVTIESRWGTVIRTLARRRYAPGRIDLSWNGLDRSGKRVLGGAYQVRVVATNRLGRVELVRRFAVQRTARPSAARK